MEGNLGQELAAGYLVLASHSTLHFLALRTSELFRFACKNAYFPGNGWEHQLVAEAAVTHLLSYSLSTVVDQLFNRITGQFGVAGLELSRGQAVLLFYGLNEQFRLLGGLKLGPIFKRLNELDRQLVFCRQNGQDFRR